MRIGSVGTSEGLRGIVVGLALALPVTTVSVAQERPTVTRAAVAEQPAAAKAKEQPKGGIGEGIKVHGHWTIEVKNPDGTLASHMEFENSLVPGSGSKGLSVVLGGIDDANSPGAWTIVLGDGLSGGPCGSNTQPAPCRPAVGVDQAVALTGTLELKTSTPVTATHDSVIASVATELRTSHLVAGGEFSHKDLAPADQKPVATGQIIQVTVRFTFS